MSDESFNRAQREYDNRLPDDGEDRIEDCEACEGTGKAPGASPDCGPEPCSECNGEGKINWSDRRREAKEAALEDRADAERDEHE